MAKSSLVNISYTIVIHLLSFIPRQTPTPHPLVVGKTSPSLHAKQRPTKSSDCIQHSLAEERASIINQTTRSYSL